ncbi:MAG: hypothetical protein WEB53_09250 [Akkermansiaceae bacterium]
MKLNTTTTIAALVLIGFGGFMAGRVSSPAPTAGTESGPAETRASRSSTATSSSTSDSRKSARSSRTERASRTLDPKDRTARLENIVRGENPLDRNRALLAFIDQLAPGDFEEAVAHFRSLGLTEDRMGEYSLLLSAWAQTDPIAALAYAEENTRSNFAKETILTSWATADPEAAIAWANANFDGEGANPYLAGIIRGIAESDPTRASQLLTAMPRSEERGEGLDAFLPQLLRQGADATRAWIASLTDDSLKNGAMLRSAEQLAASDPAGTVSWLIENPSEATQRRMDDVYSVWARKDQQAALTSLNRLPAGDVRSNALRGVISSVASDDPKSAISLMDQYSNDVTDRVVQNFIWHSFGTDPTTAAGQISRIGDEGQRNQMYTRAIGSWLRRDPDAAQAWLRTNPLPEKVQTELDRRTPRQ